MNMSLPQSIEFSPSDLSPADHERAAALFDRNLLEFQDFVEAVSPRVCAFVLDHSGCIRYLSATSEHVLEVRAEDVLGMPWEEMVAWRCEAVLAGLEAERRIIERKKPLRLLHRFFSHGGEHRAVRVWAAPVLDDGIVTGIGGYLERVDYRLAAIAAADDLEAALIDQNPRMQ